MKVIPFLSIPAWLARINILESKCVVCHKRRFLRGTSLRKIGITMGETWYCTSKCFELGAESQISLAMTAGMMHATHAYRMPLGLICVSRGMLTREQLRVATLQQKATGGEIGEILIQQGSMTEKQVTAARAIQWDCPVFAASKSVARSAVHVPPKLTEIYSMIPLHYVSTTNVLWVGFVYGIEYGLLYAIEQMTGCKTQPCFITPSEFQLQMQMGSKALELSGEGTPKEVAFDLIQAPSEIARVMSTYCVDCEAAEVMIEKCKDYLWSRLKHGPTAFDLLFKAS